MNMVKTLSTATLRLVIRALFSIGVLLWGLILRQEGAWVAATVLSGLYLAFAVAVRIQEHRRGPERSEPVLYIYPDLLFLGFLVAGSGGLDSEFHHLFYVVIALRAPFASLAQSLLIPAACTAIYAAAIWPTYSAGHLGDLVIRISLFWFLPPLLRGISNRAVGERERAERLAQTLSSTHDEVRRYTAALERASVENERRLAQITLLHQFGFEVRKLNGYEPVYKIILAYLARASEAPWVVLAHQRDPSSDRLVFRHWNDPPSRLVEWCREKGLNPECGADGVREVVQLDDGQTVTVQVFVRCTEESSSATATLAFPAGLPLLDKAQAETIAILMDSVAQELELVRLQESLQLANAQLTDSNRHLVRMHELQAELSRSFLDHGHVEDVVSRIQGIMAKELFELDRLNLFLPNWKKGILECRTSVGIGNYPQDRIFVPMDRKGGAIAKAFRDGKTIFFDGKRPVPEEYRLAEPFNRIPAIRSRIFVIVPLIDHLGNVLGVIGADRKHSHQPIPQETVTMLEFFARHVALVLAAEQLQGEGASR